MIKYEKYIVKTTLTLFKSCRMNFICLDFILDAKRK